MKRIWQNPAFVCLTLGGLSILGILLPTTIRRESTAFTIYRGTAIVSSLTVLMGVITLFALAIKRSGIGKILCCAIGVLFGGYAFVYVAVAFEEQERGLQLLACCIRLSRIQTDMAKYARTHGGQFPTRLEDLPTLPPCCMRCDATGKAYVLWPDGVPTRSSFRRTTIVAAEAVAGHRSPWILRIVPLPYFGIKDLSMARFWEEYPELKKSVVADPKKVEWELSFGKLCDGPVSVSADGSISVPGERYTPILGLKSD